MTPTASPRDQGQAVVELALALPIVCLLALATVQVGLITRDQLIIDLAAREAARAAAVSRSPANAAAAAVDRIPLSAVRVAVQASAADVTVTVRATSITDVPLVGAVIPNPELSASVVMAREPP